MKEPTRDSTDLGSGRDRTPAGEAATAGNGGPVPVTEIETFAVGRLYEELRRLAAWYLRRERDGHTLQATALVNEAFVRLMESGRLQFEDRNHYLTVAARTMRRVLVDHARAKRTEKRGGSICLVALTPDIEARPGESDVVSVLELDQALTALAVQHERAARAIELRIFASLTLEQLAQAMHVSRKTAAADLRYARAWLSRALQHGEFAP